MRNFIKIIFLLLALSFVGAGIPLYMDTIDVSQGPDNESVAAPSATIHYDLMPLNASQYELHLELLISDTDSNIPPNPHQLVNIHLASDEKVIRELPPYEIPLTPSVLPEVMHTYEETILLDQKILDIPDGRYQLTLLPQDLTGHSLTEPLEISVPFSAISTYEHARYEPIQGQTALRLFFPDESSRFLIPVTRFVPQTNTTLRETVTQLEAGPASSFELFNRSPIPPVPRIQLSAGTASLYLQSDLGFYNEYSNVAEMAALSLVESLGSIAEVNRIQFYFNNQILESGFRSVDTSDSIEPTRGPFIYQVFVTPGGRGLLLPQPVRQDILTPSALFDQMTFSASPDLYGYEIQPSIPNGIRLLSYEQTDDLLVLNLSEEFEQLASTSPLRFRMMTDSLTASMLSLEPINRVQVLVNGQIPVQIPDDQYLEPIQFPIYLNPEP